ncbi:MAG: hypothetical protein ACE5HD_06390 [Acidobacteriota bacterium]
MRARAPPRRFGCSILRPGAAHGRDVEQEDHPNPKDWVAAVMAEAERNGGKMDWVQRGLCVDERGVGESISGLRRGRQAIC